MPVVDHYDSTWVLGYIVHDNGHDSALFLSIKSFLSKFTVISFTQNYLFSFVRIRYIFIDAIF
jgi:hypothetical protein